MARRRIERLQGVQFCRRTMEIRSEVSRPPDLFRTAAPRNRKVSSLLFPGFGRAGATANASAHFSALVPLRFVGLAHPHAPSSTIESGHGGLCPHPPRNLRFLGFSFRCRVHNRTLLHPQSQAQAATTAAQRRRLAPRPHQKRNPAVKRRPPARRPRRLNAAAIARGLRPQAQAVASHLARTRNATQRSSHHHGGADRVA